MKIQSIIILLLLFVPFSCKNSVRVDGVWSSSYYITPSGDTVYAYNESVIIGDSLYEYLYDFTDTVFSGSILFTEDSIITPLKRSRILSLNDTIMSFTHKGYLYEYSKVGLKESLTGSYTGRMIKQMVGSEIDSLPKELKNDWMNQMWRYEFGDCCYWYDSKIIMDSLLFMEDSIL